MTYENEKLHVSFGVCSDLGWCCASARCEHTQLYRIGSTESTRCLCWLCQGSARVATNKVRYQGKGSCGHQSGDANSGKQSSAGDYRVFKLRCENTNDGGRRYST